MRWKRRRKAILCPHVQEDSTTVAFALVHLTGARFGAISRLFYERKKRGKRRAVRECQTAHKLHRESGVTKNFKVPGCKYLEYAFRGCLLAGPASVERTPKHALNKHAA